MTSVGTVIMAVHKPAPALLERQVASLRDQTLTDWMCLVGIDGRDPETSDLLQGLVDGDPRFEIHEFESNVGHYLNFARLAELASRRGSQWIAFADQDDWWHSDKLERLVPLLGRDVSGVTAQARVVNLGTPVGLTMRKQVSLFSLLCSNQVTGSTSVFRGDVLEAACPLPAPRAASYHDHWFGAVSFAHGKHLFVEDVVQDYVQHSDNVLGEETGRTLMGRLRTLTRRRTGSQGPIHALVFDRWGWRVEMARELSTRVPTVRLDPDVRAMARGSVNRRVLTALVRGVAQREVPLLRGVALSIGAIMSVGQGPALGRAA